MPVLNIKIIGWNVWTQVIINASSYASFISHVVALLDVGTIHNTTKCCIYCTATRGATAGSSVYATGHQILHWLDITWQLIRTTNLFIREIKTDSYYSTYINQVWAKLRFSNCLLFNSYVNSLQELQLEWQEEECTELKSHFYMWNF